MFLFKENRSLTRSVNVREDRQYISTLVSGHNFLTVYFLMVYA
jgi:hypothetical protein